MIEKILKRQKGAFLYGEVIDTDTVQQRVEVAIGGISVWINTSLSLAAGDKVICARDENKQKFIVQAAVNARPSVNTLLLV